MNLSIKIGSKKIGSQNPVFIIAEAGVNHNGSVTLAKKLIDAAKNAGADAIKFQTFNPDTLVTKTARQASYQEKNWRQESQYEMLKRLMLKREHHVELKSYAERKGLIFLSTPFSHDDAEFLLKLGVAALKIGSSDTNNTPLLSYVTKYKIPLLISTGMSEFSEIKNSVQLLRRKGNQNFMLFHCVTSYPAPLEKINLKMIPTLQALKIPIGYSDHTSGIEAPLAAVALGAVAVEKHLTLNKKMMGPDHKASLEPSEFKMMVEGIRAVEKLLGSSIKKLSKEEKQIAKVARKSVVALCDIKKGETFNSKNIGIKRPGTGLAPYFYPILLGKKSLRSLRADELLTKRHYEK